MKKTFLILSMILLSFMQNTVAQSFISYMQQGKNFYNKSEFLTALERFDLAYEFAKTDNQNKEAQKWKNRSRDKIREQQDKLIKAVNDAEKQKLVAEQAKQEAEKMSIIAMQQQKIAVQENHRAKIALRKALIMQKKMETAIFDRAVAARNKDWTSNLNYSSIDEGYMDIKINSFLDDERKRILEKVDTLDLSFNGLTRIPAEVKDCKNLKSINLLGNAIENWDDAFLILNKSQNLQDIKISLHVLDSLPEKYQGKITGLKTYSRFLSELPADIYKLKQLSFLDLCGKWYRPQQQEMRVIIMTPEEKKLRSVSLEIVRLQNLKTLYLNNNGLSELPPEIGQLLKLEELILVENEIKTLPKEIKQMNLKLLDLRNNDFSSSEIEKIKRWFPNCKIKY